MATKQEIRIVVFQEHGTWVGQCLEYDVGAQASDLPSLLARLEIAIQLEAPFEGIEPAPKHYHDMYQRCETSLNDPRFQAPLALCA